MGGLKIKHMYKLFENIKLAIKAIWGKKTRSILTMLGVIIGVFSIVLLIGIGEGVKNEVTGQIEGLGSNLLFISPGAGQSGGPLTGGVSFDPEDIDTIEGVSGIKDIVPVSIIPLPVSDKEPTAPSQLSAEELQDLKNQDSESGNVFTQTQITPMATTINADKAFTGDIFSGAEYGRMYTQEEYDAKEKVAVILSGAWEEFFPDVGGDDIVGKTIYIGKEEFKIVGGVKSQNEESGGLFGSGEQLGNIVIVPLTVGYDLMGEENINQIAITVGDTENVDDVKENIRLALLESHDGVEDFNIVSQDELLDIFDQILGVLTTMLGGIAAISLLVGGIGVMNIMLVSVTERTREIGLRKAIGASGSDILIQFIVEAIFLTFLGGVVGILLAYAGSFIMDTQFGFSPSITLQSVLMAFAFTTFIGIVFGIAPAVRASRLNPIDALKYE